MKLLYCYIAQNTEGNKVHIDSFMKAFKSLGDEIIDAGITVKPFVEDKAQWSLLKKIQAKLIWIGRNLSNLWRLSLLIFKFHPEVLLFRFTSDHTMFLAIYCLSFFYPIVLEVNAIRSVEGATSLQWLSVLLDKVTFKRARRCFTVSSMLKDLLAREMNLDAEKISVIENGVDVDMFNPAVSSIEIKKSLGLETVFVVGFVGAFMPWHGVDLIIDLAGRMKEHDIKFLLVGDGERREIFVKQAESMGLQEKVIFTGYLPHADIPKYMAAMDVVLAPFPRAYYEGCGGFYGSVLKIFEYMGMGKAIIAPPLGQIKDVLVDRESGLLIYSEDTTTLIDALLKLFNDSSYRESLGINARKRVEQNYTWQANAEKVKCVCNEVRKWVT
ncbi:MAG: glycosyltransferase family 4 protein [Desulfobacteraceae bacterium]